MKVLSGMAGFNGIRVPEMLGRKLPVLRELGFDFGNSLVNIGGNAQTMLWVAVAMLAVLSLKNSIQLRDAFSARFHNLVLTVGCFCISVLMIGKVSEFLYFNF